MCLVTAGVSQVFRLMQLFLNESFRTSCSTFADLLGISNYLMVHKALVSAGGFLTFSEHILCIQSALEQDGHYAGDLGLFEYTRICLRPSM